MAALDAGERRVSPAGMARADQRLAQAEKVTEWLKEIPRRMASVMTLINEATVQVAWPPTEV